MIPEEWFISWRIKRMETLLKWNNEISTLRKFYKQNKNANKKMRRNKELRLMYFLSYNYSNKVDEENR